MPDSLPTVSEEALQALIESVQDEDAERAAFCGCQDPLVRDRMCLWCKRPNLAAMIAWRADGCRCRRPDDEIRGIKLRSCRRCDKPVFDR